MYVNNNQKTVFLIHTYTYISLQSLGFENENKRIYLPLTKLLKNIEESKSVSYLMKVVLFDQLVLK